MKPPIKIAAFSGAAGDYESAFHDAVHGAHTTSPPEYGGKDWRAAIANAKEAAQAAIAKADPQYSYMKAIREALPDDGIVVDEVTQLGYILWYGYPVHQPRRLVSSGFSGTLGYGFPTALGVKVANPDRPVVSVAGDGGFLFDGSDLATATQFGINAATVGKGYDLLRHEGLVRTNRRSGSVVASRCSFSSAST